MHTDARHRDLPMQREHQARKSQIQSLRRAMMGKFGARSQMIPLKSKSQKSFRQHGLLRDRRTVSTSCRPASFPTSDPWTNKTAKNSNVTRNNTIPLKQSQSEDREYMSPKAVAGVCTREERRRRLLTRRREEKQREERIREDREVAAIAKTLQVASDRETARRKLAVSRVRAKKVAQNKMDIANRHNARAIMLYTGWKPWAKILHIAHLRRIKAHRHYAYCAMHRMWTKWMNHTANLRAKRSKCKKEQIERLVKKLETYLLTKNAWTYWSYHCNCLTQCSSRVRMIARHAARSKHYGKWVNAWTSRASHRAIVEQDASTMGHRATKSRFFRRWKAALEDEREYNLLAEERRQIRQQVDKWLKPMDSL